MVLAFRFGDGDLCRTPALAAVSGARHHSRNVLMPRKGNALSTSFRTIRDSEAASPLKMPRIEFMESTGSQYRVVGTLLNLHTQSSRPRRNLTQDSSSQRAAP